jgi:hypothetical protein
LFPLKTRAKCLSMVSRNRIASYRATYTNHHTDHRR